jgi:putative ABC transport system permease protein
MDFARLVLVALILIIGPMYFALDTWLNNFAARITLSPWIFIMPGLVVLSLAILTVSYHTLKTAFVNPASTLRY